MKTIGGLFGRSAFGPLHEQALKVNQCIQTLVALIGGWVQGDWERVEKCCAELHTLESQADDIKHEIRTSLSSSIFGSVERGEILEAVKRMDDVADRCEDAAKLLEMRRTPCPPSTQQPFLDLAGCLTTLGNTLEEITRMLRQVTSGVFDKGVVRSVNELVGRAGREEYEADESEQALLRALFDNEKEVDPVSVMMVYDIARRLGHVGDEAENAADVLRRFAPQR